MAGPTREFWEQRFAAGDTPWDRGAANPQLGAWQPDRPFDAVYEQTCLCALYPDHWRAYADQLHRWLAPNGKLFALFVQVARPGAAEGAIQGPPYHCDINAMRALFPAPNWSWPKPPYPRVTHPAGFAELAVVLERCA